MDGDTAAGDVPVCAHGALLSIVGAGPENARTAASVRGGGPGKLGAASGEAAPGSVLSVAPPIPAATTSFDVSARLGA
jgi:hypothetical protein